jgi:hypothetical protein
MVAFSHSKLFACVLASSAALFSDTADAAIVTFNFTGSTTATISDATNYFGLGTAIGAGTDYSFSATYDESLGTRSGTGGICGSGCNFSAVSYASELPARDGSLIVAGPSHVTNLELSMNGRTLVIDTNALTQHLSVTELSAQTIGARFLEPCGVDLGCLRSFSNSSEGVSINGGRSANGDVVDVQFRHVLNQVTTNYVATGPNAVVLPRLVTNTESLLGSVALILFATDGSRLADIAGQNAFGVAEGEIPVPAALPLFLAGMAGLGALGRIRGLGAGGFRALSR